MTWYDEALHCLSHRRIKFSYKSAHFRQTSFHTPTAATSVIFQCYRYETTANSLLQVKVDSVTGREDSLRDSLDFCYMIYFLFWVKVKYPLLFLRMRSL